jgi:hypothetical protein
VRIRFENIWYISFERLQLHYLWKIKCEVGQDSKLRYGEDKYVWRLQYNTIYADRWRVTLSDEHTASTFRLEVPCPDSVGSMFHRNARIHYVQSQPGRKYRENWNCWHNEQTGRYIYIYIYIHEYTRTHIHTRARARWCMLQRNECYKEQFYQ